MPRSLTTSVGNTLTATRVRPALLVSAAFADNTVYIWTGVGDLVWGGNTYKGVGTFGNLSTVSEGSEVMAAGITLTLSGIPTDLLNESLNEVTSGQMAKVYLAFLDESGAIIPDPIPAFIGILDQPVIDIGTDTSTIAITVENRLADLNRTRGGRLTDQDQRSRYPNDASLKWVHYLQDTHFLWK